MTSVEDYVSRIEETCGEEKDLIVHIRHEKKEEVIARILERARKEKSISNIVFELTFKGVSFRLYSTGKAIFRKLKGKSELRDILSELLL
jgi:hypothetical protein